MSFTHLHVHTDYSVDGIAKIPDLFKEAGRLGQPGLAITDHGTMAGVPAFLHEARKYPDIKPVVGCEFYLESNRHLYHLILLAKNLKGYHNLVKLCSAARTGHNDSRPRITHELLQRYHENLICTSACIGGAIPQAVLAGDYDKAKEIASWYRGLFGEDFYLEVSLHKGGQEVRLACSDDRGAYLRANHELVAKQTAACECILRLAAELGIKVIATNDVHFVSKDDAIAHDAFLCSSHNKLVSDPDRIRYSHLEYLKSEEEMAAVFPNHPELIGNTMEILSKVEKYDISMKPQFPQMPHNSDKEFFDAVWAGAEKRYGKITPEIEKRIQFEVCEIIKQGLTDYFLMMKEIVDRIGTRGIAMSPGRGAAPSSVVCYCLGITDVDPVQFGLLSGRFIWQGRPTLPWIDLDVQDGRWDEVLSILTDMFGQDGVALVPVYPELSKLTAWDAVAKRLGVTKREQMKFHELLMPDDYLSQGQWYARRAKFKDAYNKASDVTKEAYECAEKLSGVIYGQSIHASALAISKGPLSETVPGEIALGLPDEDHSLTTQYDGRWLEDTGTLLLHVLSLRVLDSIEKTEALISERKGVKVNLESIPLDDSDTLALFASGKTADIFMFQFGGMQDLLRDFAPESFSDLVLLNALYRPGLMDYLPLCLARKRGEEMTKYEIPGLEEIFAESYGIPVYQEQLMLAARLVGLDPYEDEDRKFMKLIIMKRESFLYLRDKFIEGGVSKGNSRDTMEALYERLFKEGRWAFNKSHSVSYTLLAFRCAWLKAHFPKEYTLAYKDVFPED
jgi:DNA polymerase-3 subunit alpha